MINNDSLSHALQSLMLFPKDKSFEASAIQAFNNFWNESKQASYPPTDIFVDTSTGNLVVELAVSGFDEHELTVLFSNATSTLTISGRKEAQASRDNNRQYIKQKSIATRAFERKFGIQMPVESINPHLKSGILSVIIIFKDEESPQEIKISS